MEETVWQQLHDEAVAAMQRAYAPYSRFPVGAAAITTDGRIISGCNVENAAYGATLCAECSLISQLFATGGGKLLAFACVNGRGEALAPCGRCRQLLSEHADDRLILAMPAGHMSIDEVLPGRFGASNIHDVVDSQSVINTTE
ncbi:cytidine deaminase [Actinomyces vulturis]|uniref:cytidine deaminase n=1 Tax=Actinomyces vulturis TaxID=1857645 RepID=UPI001C400B01|nr:cytidine deaminase [Actinomyces vulturis]